MRKHIIKVKYLGATNHRPSRIKLTSFRFGQSITLNLSYDSDKSSLLQAVDYLKSKGFEIDSYGELDSEHDVISTSTFEEIR